MKREANNSAGPLFPNLAAEMARRGEDDSDLAILLGYTRQNVQSKRRGRIRFNLAEIDTLCKHFGCSYEYLFARQEKGR